MPDYPFPGISVRQPRRIAWITGHLDMPHTFTFNGDMAQALITLAQDERAWGRAWHVPSPPAVTSRELARRYAVAAGRPPLKLIQLPRFAMRTVGLVVPIAREMAEMDYQWYEPSRSTWTRRRQPTPSA